MDTKPTEATFETENKKSIFITETGIPQSQERNQIGKKNAENEETSGNERSL
jgi:hypothetical protein